jgi:hypothetical protein
MADSYETEYQAQVRARDAKRDESGGNAETRRSRHKLVEGTKQPAAKRSFSGTVRGVFKSKGR